MGQEGVGFEGIRGIVLGGGHVRRVWMEGEE